MKTFLVLLLAGLAVAEYHKPAFVEDVRNRPGERIIQGSPAVNGQFPYQAFILTTQSNGATYACGGSLISRRWILTAAHCVIGAYSRVHLGNVYHAQSPVVTMTTNLRPHPSYNPNNLNNDIGLIGLDNDVALTDYIKVVPFSKDPQATFVGQYATVSGFGLTANSGSVSPSLNYVGVRVISNDECTAHYGPEVVIYSTVCAVSATSNSAQGTCSGDSGGPLVVDLNGVTTQMGVVSFVSSVGCTSSAPNGFVRPNYFVQWINSVTGI